MYHIYEHTLTDIYAYTYTYNLSQTQIIKKLSIIKKMWHCNQTLQAPILSSTT